MGKDNGIDFVPPAAAGKAFVPKSVTKDPAHTVQGLDGAPPLIEPAPVQIGPKIGGRVELDKEPKPPEEKAAPVVEDKGPRLCPSCGWDVNNPVRPEMPDIQDKRMWVSHILGEPRFRKTYSLYGGEVEVTFQTRSQAEDDTVFAQLKEDVKTGSLPNTQPLFLNVEYGHRMHTYFMAYSVEKVASRAGKVAFKIDEGGDTQVRQRLEVLKKGVSEGLFLNLIEMQRRFEAMVRILVARGSDPNFWEPTAG